jgi:hypothetical protein
MKKIILCAVALFAFGFAYNKAIHDAYFDDTFQFNIGFSLHF